MINYQELYEKWLNSPALTEEEKLQLKAVENDETEKEDRFYKELEFGTAGLRGKVGMGSNRMNRFIIARATKALAQTIIDNGLQEKGIAIAHDPRLFSKEFAKLAALVMASNGVKAYLFEDLRPTPELSFAVRYLGTASGINITASHNPKEYNGYKVYWQEGSQIKSDISDKVLEYINSMDIFEEYVTLTEEEALEKGLLVYIGEEVDEEFYKESLNCTINEENIDKNISVDELFEKKEVEVYSRIPVYEDEADNIVGILFMKDLMIEAYRKGFQNVKLTEIMQEAYFVPETKNVNELFNEMQAEKKHIAILIDEYGGFSGIVTLEDLIEEVMGNIADEFDADDSSIKKLAANKYFINGELSLNDLNDYFHIELESKHYDTLSGLLIEHMGYIPEDDEDIAPIIIDGISFKPKRVKDKKIEWVLAKFNKEENLN